ncbi:MAG TPA: family 43 glycosylhydrolase [Dinghuibacter sp.]|uniref:family 43 glycosylhydrolase n=1 Tax=Dinghuibacter sp. TaxID=2024697 RepID=UPI002CC8DE33|nr:family 43 glycosylhydrolase [Dinghuibacter sp.]HTJ11931.1 family 43 glycosylhydrolase [Dinghuibacter sp.]
MERRTFLRAGLLPFMASSFLRPAASPAKSLPEGREFFYRPEGAWAADFIPLYTDGRFELFYLHDWRDGAGHGEGVPWYRISTTDFVHFTEHGQMLARGTAAEQDLYVFTGSAIRAEGRFHIFYTGHNYHLAEQGKPAQGIMHATSDDLTHWQKHPSETFFAPADRYEKDDWRDAFVFFDPSSARYFMLVAARNKNGIPRRRGLTACCSSTDLTHWTVEEPLYDPGLYFTHECPDLFQWGDWWYLVFSEFTDKVRTRYRMSRSWKGPWLIPEHDDFDGHAFYAAKTAADGHRRFLFGWNPTRDGSKDTGGWQWGGNLVVHELWQQPGGELGVRMPASVFDAFSTGGPASFATGAGSWKADGSDVTLKGRGSYAVASAGTLPSPCLITATLTPPSAGQGDFGLWFYGDMAFDQAYYIRFEPSRGRMVFDKWPRERSEVPQMAELERVLPFPPGDSMHIRCIIDGTLGVMYVNDTVAMNFRAYDFSRRGWGFFAGDADVRITDVEVRVRP